MLSIKLWNLHTCIVSCTNYYYSNTYSFVFLLLNVIPLTDYDTALLLVWLVLMFYSCSALPVSGIFVHLWLTPCCWSFLQDILEMWTHQKTPKAQLINFPGWCKSFSRRLHVNTKFSKHFIHLMSLSPSNILIAKLPQSTDTHNPMSLPLEFFFKNIA